MKKILYILLLVTGFYSLIFADKINVVAAENQYGSVASLIGGNNVEVANIISNADGDPHTFISSVKNAKLLADADVIIYNGADYDSWVESILKSNKNARVIKVEDLCNFEKTSDLGINPHLWYDPKTFPALAKKLELTFSEMDKENSNLYSKNYQTFNQKYKIVFGLVTEINKKYKDTPVTATEPLFGYMATALGLNMKGLDFQWVVMNGSEPSPKMVIDYQKLFADREVEVLFYNKQVTDNTTKNILNVAHENDISIVGVTETMPLNKDAISWMIETLETTEKALKQAKENHKKT
ncbi:zinc ABC transporter substrate-binding protein [Allofrancisella guangzhouensis]|uniref:ABC transporter substrate-binding protein n=1 Tax=Allofrancisella guangzhouensis TaxID=594679 RepID=A0A0A8E3H5_9GAMM|nr:zinc ABC transporter substrate-binding protein [Allofrancisella guangzhouensis]AJC48538.1 ABC transporter substrate-binding protein [Allofrancisella guangzhouensis]MBK2027799.1 zinc ABC transporter substrate-binding protein [Allofrancisella guangzhouensis]MBK2044789.1 zinc ABC transporter substrate-binding protein [Allofrancisella guangzhouensis]MBK2045760.1 zinc ABC transporter substrate-binding protein [Allofrancisella guangzhouensis]